MGLNLLIPNKSFQRLNFNYFHLLHFLTNIVAYVENELQPFKINTPIAPALRLQLEISLFSHHPSTGNCYNYCQCSHTSYT